MGDWPGRQQRRADYQNQHDKTDRLDLVYFLQDLFFQDLLFLDLDLLFQEQLHRMERKWPVLCSHCRGLLPSRQELLVQQLLSQQHWLGLLPSRQEATICVLHCFAFDWASWLQVTLFLSHLQNYFLEGFVQCHAFCLHLPLLLQLLTEPRSNMLLWLLHVASRLVGVWIGKACVSCLLVAMQDKSSQAPWDDWDDYDWKAPGSWQAPWNVC